MEEDSLIAQRDNVTQEGSVSRQRDEEDAIEEWVPDSGVS
jgi:hypothetical protein